MFHFGVLFLITGSYPEITKNYESEYSRESFLFQNSEFSSSNKTLKEKTAIRLVVVNYKQSADRDFENKNSKLIKLPESINSTVDYHRHLPLAVTQGGVKLYFRTCYDGQVKDCVKNAEKSEITCALIFVKETKLGTDRVVSLSGSTLTEDLRKKNCSNEFDFINSDILFDEKSNILDVCVNVEMNTETIGDHKVFTLTMPELKNLESESEVEIFSLCQILHPPELIEDDKTVENKFYTKQGNLAASVIVPVWVSEHHFSANHDTLHVLLTLSQHGYPSLS